MNIIELIEKKKQGKKYSFEDLKFIVDGYLSGDVADYQMSAILMAIYFNGLDIEETTMLTDLTVKSGRVLDFSDVSSDVVDKHSTGGVGDKITLILLPLLAAAGVSSAKLSGRGLGNTGGTIDKLESIPGFNTEISTEKFVALIKENGVAIGAQTSDLTPADGKMYALRDVTATVDIIPLIACSVVSKKIASGANHIILDVKCGEGAFMTDLNSAKKLAEMMTEIGKRLGRNVGCLITNMSMPLGRAVGNALEVYEVIEFLKGNMPEDLKELTFEQAAAAMIKSGVSKSKGEAFDVLEKLIASGKALEKFKEIIEAQGGDGSVIREPFKLLTAHKKMELRTIKEGYVSNISAQKIAKACKILGAGRTKKGEKIDYAVGIYLNKKYGEKVSEGEVVATIHYNDVKNLNEAFELVMQAFSFQKTEPEKLRMIYERVNI